ncbi:MAG: Lrp/AsnC family transcriptional regulator [Marivivens sp.]|nr:Lrp/AsnC family transcriptional regulator [Marivivens sp.]
MGIDHTDRRILHELQSDASLSLDEIGDRVGLSRNACWRRIKSLEDDGVIRSRVTLLDAEKLGLALTVIMLIRTRKHDPDWLTKFSKITKSMPEILGAYRMSGDLDYLVRARVADVPAYDQLYKRLIAKIDLSDVSASFVMEEIKETTALPVY